MKLTFSKTAPRGACIICHSVSRKKGLTSLITAGSKVAPLASGIPKHLSMPHNVTARFTTPEFYFLSLESLLTSDVTQFCLSVTVILLYCISIEYSYRKELLNGHPHDGMILASGTTVTVCTATAPTAPPNLTVEHHQYMPASSVVVMPEEYSVQSPYAKSYPAYQPQPPYPVGASAAPVYAPQPPYPVGASAPPAALPYPANAPPPPYPVVQSQVSHENPPPYAP
ncbi:hypothetical protein V9T40_010611 [Parthenolecanium corni]|uniref:Uncharacterized protein n=1 Tax=Parthenolecanium corni TaxID=536013 RepID=A0AAN9T4H3_9HEMI